jgi:hypothetical protein
MRVRSLVAAVGLVLAFAACTKRNVFYCADAAYNSCLNVDAALDRPEAPEAGDAGDAGDANDGAADGSMETAVEVKPICSSDNDCNADAGTPACSVDAGVAACVGCTMDKHCSGTKGVCDATAQACVECTGTDAMDCKGNPGTVCKAATKTCVECINSTQCGGTTPVCDTTSNKCRPCGADTECTTAPNICVDWDHHCAQSKEVVVLQGGAGCTPSMGVFCRPGDALAARPMNGIILIQGPNPVGMIEVPVGANENILIIGRNGAVIGAGSGDVAGIHVSGGNKHWVRDLQVSGGTVGVLADGGTELHLTRCVVSNNGQGGIKTSNASFDITNSIIASNGTGTDTGGVAWGGVRLGALPNAGFGRFANNTVVNNASIGVSCTSSTYDVSTSIVFGNQGGDSVGCSGAPCCGPTNPNPNLNPTTLHLMSGSPCIDQITPSASTVTVDIDGDPRPTMLPGKLDCGADEFVMH